LLQSPSSHVLTILDLPRVFVEYVEQVERGLRTKKTVRLDPDGGSDEAAFTLGLTPDSIHAYNIGTGSILDVRVHPLGILDWHTKEFMHTNI